MTRADTDIRPLTEDEMDQVAGGFLPLAWAAFCIGAGIAAGFYIATDDPKGSHSAPGDYPTGPKDAG